MFRDPKILSCSIRSLLVGVRDPYYSASPMASLGKYCWRWHASIAWNTFPFSQKKRGLSRRGRIMEGDISFPNKTLFPALAHVSSILECEHCLLKAASQQNLIAKAVLSVHPHLPWDIAPSKLKLGLEPQPCRILKDLSQPSKGLSTCCDRSNNIKCLQPQNRPRDKKQPTVSINTLNCQCSAFLSPLFPTEWLPKVIGATPSGLTSVRCRHPPSVQQSRALHRVAPREITALTVCLSLENEQRCRRSLRHNMKLYEAGKGAGQAQGKGQGRWASILVSLCSVQDEPAFLFTLRSSMLKGEHKGDVSFAGGKNDPSDKDVVDTALREAQEELGVTVATDKVWGILKPLRNMSGLMIAPVLANLGPIEDLSFKPNPGEVEEIFTLSLSHLCNPLNRGYTHFRTGDKYGYTFPVFRNGKHRVWGLTAIALSHTLALILPP